MRALRDKNSGTRRGRRSLFNMICSLFSFGRAFPDFAKSIILQY
jgi:hypothetical protein